MNIYDAEYNFDDYLEMPKRVICLYFVPRSGSNLLAYEMKKTNKLGYPLEYFNKIRITLLSKMYFDNCKILKDINILNFLFRIRTSPNGTFSFKWHSGFKTPFKSIIDILPIQKFNIFIDREDRIRQAESFYIAKKYDDWFGSRSNYHEKVLPKDLKESIDFLSQVRKETLEMIKADDRKCLIVSFEELLKNTKSIINDILNFVSE